MRTNREKVDQDAKNLSDAAREARNAANREWRKKNPAKVREYNRRYWERKAEKAGRIRKDEPVEGNA